MSAIHASAIVDASAEIGEGAVIGPFCVVGPQVRIGEGTRLMSHVVLDGRTTIGRQCTIFPFASIGTQTQDLKFRGGATYVEVGDGTTLREYVTVNSGTNEGEVTRVGARCHIMAYCHVAHACRVGDGVIMANGATLAGEVEVEDGAVVGGLVGVHQFVRIGRMAIVGGCSKVTQDCPPYMMIDGNPPRVGGLNRVGLKRHGIAEDVQWNLRRAHRVLYRENLTVAGALEKIEREIPAGPEVTHLTEFVRSSKRGIVR